jgi:DNA ligase (NAD+)
MNFAIDMLQKIADLPGWGNVSSENLADSIEAVASKGVPLSRFIYSLSIPFIGTHASNLIAATYKTADSFLHALDEASSYSETESIDEEPHPFVLLTGDEATDKVKGIGPVALSSLLVYSKEKVLVDAAKDLARALTIHDDADVQQNDTADDDSPFKDMVVVFTGTLPMSRSAAQNAVKTRGAKSTPNTISKSTTLVVVGDKGGKKEKQAKELGVRVMDADEFMQIISL